MSVVFQGFAVFLEVEVGIAQLAVDGTEGLQVFCSDLDGSLEESCSAFKVAGLAQTLSFQSQLQAGGLHPTGGTRRFTKTTHQRLSRYRTSACDDEVLLYSHTL